MAVYNIIPGGGNFSANATWGGGGHPVAGDTANLSGLTGTLTIDVASACAIFNATGCTGTVLMNNSMTTTGNVTLVAGMVFTPNGQTWNMGCAGTTLTTGGKSFYNMNFSVTGTMTLADTCNVSGLLSVASGITATLATSNLSVAGGITNTGTGVITGQTIT